MTEAIERRHYSMLLDEERIISRLGESVPPLGFPIAVLRVGPAIEEKFSLRFLRQEEIAPRVVLSTLSEGYWLVLPFEGEEELEAFVESIDEFSRGELLPSPSAIWWGLGNPLEQETPASN